MMASLLEQQIVSSLIENLKDTDVRVSNLRIITREDFGIGLTVEFTIPSRADRLKNSISVVSGRFSDDTNQKSFGVILELDGLFPKSLEVFSDTEDELPRSIVGYQLNELGFTQPTKS